MTDENLVNDTPEREESVADEERDDEEQTVEESEELDEQAGEETGEPDERAKLQAKLKETIDVRVEEVAPLRKTLTITVPRATLNEQLDEQYGELRREAMVPGFRKGRAPRRLLEKRFGHEVAETLVSQIVGNGYLAAVEKADLKILGDPLFWATEKGADTATLVDLNKAVETITIPEDGPLVFSCEVEVQPEFELPTIKGIPLKKPTVPLTESDVDEQVDRLRTTFGRYRTVDDGEVQGDDLVIADITMTSGEKVLKQQAKAQLFARGQVVDGVPLDKLGEVLAGAKVGDVRTITGEIPDTYVKPEFRGRPVTFEFTLREIFRFDKPTIEVTAERLGCENEQELRDWARRFLENGIAARTQSQLADQVCQYLLDHASFDLPPRLSERQMNRLVTFRMLQLYDEGVPETEVQKRLDELKTSARDETARDLKLLFIMEKLADQIKVEVTEEEINAQIARIARRQNQRFDRVRDELIRREDGMTSLYRQIRDEKIVLKIIAMADIAEEIPPHPAGGEVSPASAAGPESPISDEPTEEST